MAELLQNFLCEMSVQSSQGLGSAILSNTAQLHNSLKIHSALCWELISKGIYLTVNNFGLYMQ